MEGLKQESYDTTLKMVLASLERNLLPDAATRRLTRLLLASRLRSGYKSSSDLQLSDLLHTLKDAEKAVLELSCERSQLKDGHTVLVVGCGWGSLSLYDAQKYSNCRITGICNSTTQKAYIEEQFRMLKLLLQILAHSKWRLRMTEYTLLECSSSFFAYLVVASYILSSASNQDLNEDDWITRFFFTGGTMPAANLLLYFQDDVSVVNHWLVNGKHYAKTSEEWLRRMDQNLGSIKPIMESTYGKDQSLKWTVYWRTFFIAVAELFGYNNGGEWMVSLILFKKK